MTAEYYSPESIEILKKQMYMSPSTWHKINNPFCGICAYERGKAYQAKLAEKQAASSLSSSQNITPNGQ